MAKAKKVDEVTGVQVRWVKGFGERRVDDLVWLPANDYVVVVTDPAMVEQLVANGDFEIVDAEAVEANGTE